MRGQPGRAAVVGLAVGAARRNAVLSTLAVAAVVAGGWLFLWAVGVVATPPMGIG